MEHIDTIHTSTICSLRISVVINPRFTYDNGSFLEYPIRTGTASNPEEVNVQDGNLQAYPIDDLAPFLQAWLFFGLLHSIFKVLTRTDYEWTDFVYRDEDGGYFITTEKLNFYIWCWAAHESVIPAEVSEYGAAHVQASLGIANRVIIDLWTEDTHETGSFSHRSSAAEKSESVGHLVFNSIIMLCESLQIASAKIYNGQARYLQSSFASPCTSLLQRRLEVAGYCQWQIERIKSDFQMDCSTIYALTFIDQRYLDKDHSKCSKTKRYGHNVNYETYKSKHILNGCTCVSLPPTNNSISVSVSWILDSGGLPLISLRSVGDGLSQLNVTYSSLVSDSPFPRSDSRYQTTTDKIPRYVAISHVWSDGLGNQEGNTMPLCVLEHIQSKVDALFKDIEEPVLFWIDTICVPKDNKLPALAIMLQTYRNAACVLVLDASLESVSSAVSPIELLLRIKASPWMQRLWTLQEGWVARELVFQFAEEAFPMEKLINLCINSHHKSKLVIEDLINQSRNLRHIRRLSRALAVDDKTFQLPAKLMAVYRTELEQRLPGFPSDADRGLAQLINKSHQIHCIFMNSAKVLYCLQNTEPGVDYDLSEPAWLFNTLYGRATSRADDETYCIANIMNIPVQYILTVEPERRMEKLLSLMPKIPATLLFSNDTCKLGSAGYSWAPTTFLGIHVENRNDGEKYGSVKDGGLQISLPGFVLLPQVTSHVDEAPLEMMGKDFVYCSTKGCNNTRLYKLKIYNSSACAPLQWNQFNGFRLEVIVRMAMSTPAGQVMDVSDAALVKTVSQDAGVRTVKFLAKIWIELSDTDWNFDGQLATFQAKWLDEDCMWRVL